MIPLQGDPFNLQGSAPSIQGGQVADILQPASSPIPIAPRGPAPVVPVAVPKAAPKPVVAKAVKPVAAPVAPVAMSGVSFYRSDPKSQQVYDAQGNPLSYAQYIAAGGRPDFKNVINGQVPGLSAPAAAPVATLIGQPTPGQPVSTDPTQALGQAAGQAGLGFDDYLKILAGQNGLTADETKAIRDSLGLDTLEGSVFSQPSKTTEQLYTDAYTSAGLSDVKQKIADLDAKIAEKQKQLTNAQGVVNENPFLDESNRVGRLKRLNDQGQAEINNLLAEKQQYADLYNQGLTEVNNVVTRNSADFNQSKELNAQKLAYLTSKANELITQKQNEKLASVYGPGLTSFLSAKAGAQKPETIGTADTGFFQWDPITRTFKQITAPQTKLPDSAKEYEYAKANGYKGSYTDYQNEDANRKRSIARAGAAVYANGLSNQELTQVQKIAGQFDNEPIVKNYNIIAEGKAFVDSISNNTQNPADQQGLIYAFAKAMDPNSVVREGEYATVQKYAQSWAQSFGFNAARIFSNSPFLSPDAIANMKATINAKYNASKNQYDNVYSEYGRRVDQITGKPGGTEFITNYAAANTPAQGGNTSSNVSLEDLF
jgi:hypothetical protein